MRGAKTGILFVHGIVGNSKIFQFLLPAVPDGCELLSITLAVLMVCCCSIHHFESE